MTTASGMLSAQAAIVWTMLPNNFTIMLLIFLVHYAVEHRAAVLCPEWAGSASTTGILRLWALRIALRGP